MLFRPDISIFERRLRSELTGYRGWHRSIAPIRSFLLLWLMGITVAADTVEMQNGDRYNGKLLSVDTSTVVIQSEVLGTVRLPRSKMASLTVSPEVGTNAVATPAAPTRQPSALTNPVVDLSAALRQLGGNTNFIQQVQSQILAGAGPEANKKFNDLVAGMMSGRVTVNDIRNEASSAVKQLKELKLGLGDGIGEDLDGYLAILESFLRETAPDSQTATNKPPAHVAKPSPESKK